MGSIKYQRINTGFTLIELLVVTAVLSILVGLLLPALGKAKSKAYCVNEINAAKQMMLAHRMYADDYESRLLPGYRYNHHASNRVGKSIDHPINARYPWRLAPYLAHNFEILYANKNLALLHSFSRGNEDEYTYAASVFPSMGINSVFVGGDDMVLSPNRNAFQKFGRFCVLKEAEVKRPSQLLAFSSARSVFDDKIAEGFYRVEPPYLTKRLWSKHWSADLEPQEFGFVHPRFENKAVSAMLDGHAEVLSVTEMQDMRHWSNLADNPGWILKQQ